MWKREISKMAISLGKNLNLSQKLLVFVGKDSKPGSSEQFMEPNIS